MLSSSKLNDQSSIKPRNLPTIIKRLRRIGGQVAGIERMIEDGRSCEDIMHQIMAVRSGMSQIATKLLMMESCKCEYTSQPEKLEKLFKRFMDVQ